MEDLSELEREEQLRRWWSDNWAWIIGGVALGLALLAGWQWWQRQQIQSAEVDESSYVAVVEALGKGDRDGAVAQAKALRERRPGSVYADQADLALARAAVDRNDLEDAATLLRGVADNSKDPELKLVARTRLARVLIEQSKPDDALALLDPASAGAFLPMVHEIRGDALAAKGDIAAAGGEYDAALQSAGDTLGFDRAYVELKRAALASAATAAPASSAPVQAAPAAESVGEQPAEAPAATPEAPAK